MVVGVLLTFYSTMHDAIIRYVTPEFLPRKSELELGWAPIECPWEFNKARPETIVAWISKGPGKRDVVV